MFMKLTKTQIAELKAVPFGPARIGASKELCDWINQFLNHAQFLEDRVLDLETRLKFISSFGGTGPCNGAWCAEKAREIL